MCDLNFEVSHFELLYYYSEMGRNMKTTLKGTEMVLRRERKSYFKYLNSFGVLSFGVPVIDCVPRGPPEGSVW